jgi:hypothetical protein
MKTRKRIFKGWIDPMNNFELPQKAEETTVIKFSKTKWYPQDRRCKITVEWEESK